MIYTLKNKILKRKFAQRMGAYLAATGIAAASLTACSMDATPAPSLVLVSSSNPSSPLIPGFIDSEGGRRIADMIFAGLVYYSPEGTVMNEAAQQISQENPLSYHISLKSDQKFSNGEEVNADSFINSWNYTIANSLAGAAQLSNIANLELIDDLSFRVTLHNPDSYFVEKLGQPAFFPMPASAFSDMQAYSENPIGNGPYMISESQIDTSMTLLPNSNYSGDRTPANDGLRFVYYASSQVAFADLAVNNLDIDDDLLESELDRLQNRVISQQIAANVQIVVNNEMSLEERQALSLAIDRSQAPDGYIAATDFTSPFFGLSAGIPGSEVLNYDPVLAKQLWETVHSTEEALPEHLPEELPEELPAEETVVAESVPAEETLVEETPITSTEETTSAELTIGVPTSTVSQSSSSSPVSSVPEGTATVTSTEEPSTEPSEEEVVEEPSTPDVAVEPEVEDNAEEEILEEIIPVTAVVDIPSQARGNITAQDADSIIQDLENSLSIVVTRDANTSLYLREIKAQYPSNQSFLDIYGYSQEELFASLPYIPVWYPSVRVGYSTYVNNISVDWRGVPVYYKITKNS